MVVGEGATDSTTGLEVVVVVGAVVVSGVLLNPLKVVDVVDSVVGTEPSSFSIILFGSGWILIVVVGEVASASVGEEVVGGTVWLCVSGACSGGVVSSLSQMLFAFWSMQHEVPTRI